MSPIEWHKDETLRLGIVVDWPLENPPSSGRWPDHLYAHLADDGADHGMIVYLFRLNGVDWRRRRVQGWVKMTSKSGWEPRTLPFPHAVYNRISRRDVESSGACRRLMARLAATVPVFNPRYLDKAEVQLALERSEAAPHLPTAALARDVDEIIEHIRTFRAAFIKPIRGTLGNGIMRVERRERTYRLVRNPPLGSPNPRPAERSLSRVQLRQALGRIYRGEPVLVQQAVPSSRWRGLPFDLRLLVQKDEFGEWRLSGVAGRVAAPGALTTHTIRGGSRLDYDRLAQEASTPLPTLPALETMSAHAATAVQTAVGDECFEFSLDVAVGRDGHPFILEVNAKPFPFDEAEIRRLAAKRLMAYARARVARSAVPVRPPGSGG